MYTYRPNFSTNDYREGVIDESDNHVTFEFNTPYLIGATPPNSKPYGVYDSGCKNGLVLHGKAICSVAVSLDDGRTWRDCGSMQEGLDLTDLVKGSQQYFIRFGAGARALAGSDLTMTTVCLASTSVLPHLKDGGDLVHFEASGRRVLSAGPSVARAKNYIVNGAFNTPRVTLELKSPHNEQVVAVYGMPRRYRVIRPSPMSFITWNIPRTAANRGMPCFTTGTFSVAVKSPGNSGRKASVTVRPLSRSGMWLLFWFGFAIPAANLTSGPKCT